MKCVYGWVGGRAGVRYVITKFYRMDSLPNFLTHGAPLARFARESSAKIKITQKLIDKNVSLKIVRIVFLLGVSAS